MGKLRNVGIAEQRVYDDPQNPANSNYDVALPITVPDAVIDPGTGKKLSETLKEINNSLSKKAESTHTHGNMTAATASAAGKAGLVPAPAAGEQTKYLRGDGTWQTPPAVQTIQIGGTTQKNTNGTVNLPAYPTKLPANGGNSSTVGGAAVMTTAALGLHKMSSGTAAATTSNCPAGAWYGQYE